MPIQKLSRFVPLSLRLWHRWLNGKHHFPLARYFDDDLSVVQLKIPVFVTALVIYPVIAAILPEMIPYQSYIVQSFIVTIVITVWSAFWCGLQINYFAGGLMSDELIDVLPDRRLAVLDAASIATIHQRDIGLRALSAIHIFSGFILAFMAIQLAYEQRGGLLTWLLPPLYVGFNGQLFRYITTLTIMVISAWDFRQSIVIACLIGARIDYYKQMRMIFALFFSQIVFYPFVVVAMQVIKTYDQFRTFRFNLLFAGILASLVIICIQEALIHALRHRFLSGEH